jgi:epoxide hydrolase-like predicted phosphatase
MIKAIIFDVGGVLVHNPWPAMRDHYTSHLNVDQERFQNAYDEIVEEWQKGSMPEKEFWEKMCKRLEIAMPESEDVWKKGFLHAYKENDQVFELIRTLKLQGFQIGLLSNTETSVMEFLIEKKYEHFDVFVFSCDVGMVKPYTDIYLHTVEKMGIKPSEAIFVDDKQENVDGAKAIGMKGITFMNAKQLEDTLNNLISS